MSRCPVCGSIVAMGDTGTEWICECGHRYPKKMDFNDVYKDFIDDLFSTMKELLAKKRHDYGTSYEDIRERFGPVVPLIRLNDKLMRYENLIEKGEKAQNEPIEDVFYDIIGYCVLELYYRQVVKK